MGHGGCMARVATRSSAFLAVWLLHPAEHARKWPVGGEGDSSKVENIDPEAVPLGAVELDGMCAPSSTQSCGEWCAEHGAPEADCAPCKARLSD